MTSLVNKMEIKVKKKKKEMFKFIYIVLVLNSNTKRKAFEQHLQMLKYKIEKKFMP